MSNSTCNFQARSSRFLSSCVSPSYVKRHKFHGTWSCEAQTTAHLFEGTADNYPFENQLKKEDLEGHGISVYDGAMITVLGTSLQNRDILRFFYESTWNVIGLEMEGAHYQKAIQAAAKLRGSISDSVKVRYAYYASDNPLETGSTLASGGLGTTGVKPTYLITEQILEQIFKD